MIRFSPLKLELDMLSLLPVRIFIKALIDWVVHLVQNFKFQSIKILLSDHSILCVFNRCWSWLLILITFDDTWIGKCLLEVWHLLFENCVFTWEGCIFFFQLLFIISELENDSILLFNKLFKLCLVGLASHSASHGWFSVLKSLPSFLVLIWVLEEAICTILVT